jgi:hypothetical protein
LTLSLLLQKLGQHADARELSALYIKAGVPIYPYSLGHSYHTLNWRMGVESKEMQRTVSEAEGAEDGNNVVGVVPENDSSRNANGDSALISAQRPVDRFYTERYEARAREGYSESLSYLEEKSLYWLNVDSENNEVIGFAANVRRHLSLTPNRLHARTGGFLHPGPNVAGGNGLLPGQPALRMHSMFFAPPTILGSPQRGVNRSNSHSDLRLNAPKVLVKIHRHLLDQHLLGRSSVDDGEGVMSTPPICLSADFFHPHFSIRPTATGRLQPSGAATAASFTSSDGLVLGELLPAWQPQVLHHPEEGMEMAVFNEGGVAGALDNAALVAGRGQFTVEGVVGMEQDSDSDGEPTVRPPHQDPASNDHPVFEPAYDPIVPAPQQPLPRPPPEPLINSTPAESPSPTQHYILSNVDLQVYSATSVSRKMESGNADGREMKNHLKTRFAAYHRRLETLISHDDSGGFEECLLDFWDEFLPQSANIHYYDRYTAVPRISCLQKFLTKPCPKAIGIVQCEIERIKLNSKKKGVNMKGRFFPTYEYRLFIRHRPADAADNENSESPRQDTVLMMAKNRGRKHSESGSAPVSKKGANNYYLYMPQQEDVDDHYQNANETEETGKSNPNGAGHSLMSGNSSPLLGRLQSNFIGTEFQIFSPRIGKPTRKVPTYARSATGRSGLISSDEELDYDSGVSSDNASPSCRRRSRFSFRRNLSSYEEQTTIVEDESLRPVNPARRSLRRSRSSGDVRPSRTSRRAIANTVDAPDTKRLQPTHHEEEDGAITYTANLLGSRPRIMDVCIPKVLPDGFAGGEWKKYVDHSSDVDGPVSNFMLNRFKQLQQRTEIEDQGNDNDNDIGNGNGANNTTEPVISMEVEPDEYTPPDDFGLLALQNRPPWWNIELGSFVLNFGGRVSVASVKNFQLCDRNDQDYIMLQFGRIQGRHSFTMDFQHPLTATQAFAIAISSLQSKISFG